jgi:hypothetical protein
VTRQTRREYVREIFDRYNLAPRHLKPRLLDEVCAVTGYHRKYATRLLNGRLPARKPPPHHRRPRYGPEAIRILARIWEAAGYPCSLRLKALLPCWLPWARKRYRVSPHVELQLLAISPRQMDRRLKDQKRHLKRRLYGRTKPGRLLKHHIPLRVDRWETTRPGFTEIDLVSHSGECADGEFISSLNLTDIHTTWVETRAVLGKSQVRVREALEDIRQQLPFPLCGIDSDNGSEFINDHLYRYCRDHKIQFTRGRPYKKDDNAHIEQKNWTHVRKLLGYVRYDSHVALTAINYLYGHELRLLQNLFLPSVKLVRKERVGSRTRRRYGPPQTPLERLQDCPDADRAKLADLQALRDRLDPFALSRAVDVQLRFIYSLARQKRRLPSKNPGKNPLHPWRRTYKSLRVAMHV